MTAATTRVTTKAMTAAVTNALAASRPGQDQGMKDPSIAFLQVKQINGICTLRVQPDTTRLRIVPVSCGCRQWTATTAAATATGPFPQRPAGETATVPPVPLRSAVLLFLFPYILLAQLPQFLFPYILLAQLSQFLRH